MAPVPDRQQLVLDPVVATAELGVDEPRLALLVGNEQLLAEDAVTVEELVVPR